MAVLFIGSIGLTQYLAVVAGAEETILSALARRILGSGMTYYVVQIATLLILVVAANTSFAGFPRLSAILAKDGFLPRQLSALGDRLGLNNGILLLAGGTAFLIVVFAADTHALIPLFAVGVFLAFSLSQFGMVLHWWQVRGEKWGVKAGINAIGALVTTLAVFIIGISKFTQGAWITILVIPILVVTFLKIRSHYQKVAQQLSLSANQSLAMRSTTPKRVVVPISGVHQGIVDAVNLARSLSPDVTAVYIELEPGAGEQVRTKWLKWWPDIPLVVVPSPYRSIIGPLLEYLDETDAQHDDGQLAVVVLPEFVPAKWWHALLHNQTAWLLKTALLYRRRHLGFQRVIIDVPYHLQR